MLPSLFPSSLRSGGTISSIFGMMGAGGSGGGWGTRSMHGLTPNSDKGWVGGELEKQVANPSAMNQYMIAQVFDP